MARKLFTLFLIAGGLALSACNTMRGVADDIESVANDVDEQT